MSKIGFGLSLFSREFLDDIDTQAFRDNSKQLDDFMRGDFSSMDEELAEAFPSGQDMHERYVLFAHRVAHEQATLYRQPPRREWSGVNEAQREKLEEIWASSKVNEQLHQAHLRLVLQQTMVLAFLPLHPRQYSLMHFAPHECAVQPATGQNWRDIEQAQEVQLLWPVATLDERVFYGRAIVTADSAYIDGGQGVGRASLFAGQNEGNPYGRPPLYTMRAVDPQLGRFFAPIAEDVLALNIALNLGDSDIEANLHHQAWGQKVIETDGEMAPTQMMVDELPVGPNRIMVLPVAGAKYRIVQPQPAIAPYIAAQEFRIKTAATMRDISPSRFSKANTAQTGAARAADSQDRKESRDQYKKILIAAERWMLRQVIETARIYGDPVQIPESARLEAIHYHEHEPAADPQAIAQAHALTDATGETSPIERVALRLNISREQAAARIAANIEEQKALGLVESDNNLPM